MINVMERLKRWLSDTGTTQQALGEKLGVAQPTVCDWVNGESSPKLKHLRGLSKITQLSIDELLSVPRGKPSSHRSVA